MGVFHCGSEGWVKARASICYHHGIGASPYAGTIMWSYSNISNPSVHRAVHTPSKTGRGLVGILCVMDVFNAFRNGSICVDPSKTSFRRQRGWALLWLEGPGMEGTEPRRAPGESQPLCRAAGAGEETLWGTHLGPGLHIWAWSQHVQAGLCHLDPGAARRGCTSGAGAAPKVSTSGSESTPGATAIWVQASGARAAHLELARPI